MPCFSSLPLYPPYGSGSEGYFRGPLRSTNLSPTFAEFPPDLDKLGSRTKSYALALSPHSCTLTAPPYPSSLLSPTQLGKDEAV